jgi:hypothetical protein
MRILDFRPRRFCWSSWIIGWLCGVGVMGLGHGVMEANDRLAIWSGVCLLLADINRRCLPLKIKD